MDANASSILDLFEKRHRLEIPLFQRQYVWNKEHQWAPLWEDIARKLVDFVNGRIDGPVHFLGAMVLDQKMTPSTHVDRRQVIDGQQRLTTLQIFLAAFRDFCREQKCEEIATDLDRYTQNTGRMADPETERFKVWPTQRDRDQFRDVMDARSRDGLYKKHPLTKGYRKRNYNPRPRMVEAYFFFHSQIQEFFLGTSDEKPIAAETPIDRRLDAALSALRVALQVVVIDLGPGDDAQIIFETLNARGEPLLPADLLRNYIFLRAARLGEQQEPLYAQHWKPFDDPFWREMVRQGRLIRPRSDLFMQHYLSSRRFNDVPVTHLFVEYKHWIDTKRPFPTVAAELAAIAKSREIYRLIVASPPTTRLGAFGRFLDIFDVSTIHPLLLVLIEAGPSEPELHQMLDVLESYIVRRTVCNFTTKAYNRVFLGLAQALSKQPVTAQALRERISVMSGESSVWPDDAAFSTHFLERAGYHSLLQPRLLYILKRLNETYDSARAERITMDSALTIEHLMPQEWVEHWPLADGSKGSTYLDRLLKEANDPLVIASIKRDATVQGIGNLTLLTQPLNSSIKNSAWAKKRTEIERYTLLPITRAYLSKGKWDENEIDARARDLMARAIKTWQPPVSPTRPPA